MNNFKNILLPVDGSRTSKRAMEKAVTLSKAMDSEIVLLYVTDSIPPFIKGKALEEAEKVQKEEAFQVIAPYKNFLDEYKVNYSVIIADGFRASNKICQTAVEKSCDTIVMGSRGLSDWEGAMIGSVTHRVLAHCTVPVLVVR